MRKKRNSSMSYMKIVLCFSAILMLLPTLALSEETYKFERMWPTIQQPWYFAFPRDLSMDSEGYVYVSDSGGYGIAKFSSDGRFVSSWKGINTIDGEIRPWGIAIDGVGNVYFTEDSQQVRKLASDGSLIMKWGAFGAGDGEFNYPKGIAVSQSGDVYVTDCGNQRIQKFSSEGKFITKWGTSGSGDGQFTQPSDITIDQNGYLYVVDSGNSRIQKFSQDGSFVTKWGSSGSADGEFYFTNYTYTWHEGGLFGGCIIIDKSENICVLDNGNNRIQQFTPDGRFLSKWTNVYGSRGIAAGNDGNIYPNVA